MSFGPIESFRLMLANSQHTGLRLAYARSEYIDFLRHKVTHSSDPTNIAGLAAQSAGVSSTVGLASFGSMIRKGMKWFKSSAPGKLLRGGVNLLHKAGLAAENPNMMLMEPQ